MESLGGVEAARAHLGPGPVAWRTTSPGLLAHLARGGESAASPEDGWTVPEQDALGRAAYAFATAAVKLLDERCGWRQYADMGPVFGMALAQMAHVLLHKGRMLDRVLAESDARALCVGSPDVPPMAGLALGFGRFDTLYAALAARMGQDGPEILEHADDPARLAALDAWVSGHRMGLWEKLLSLLSNTPSSFAYKVWRSLAARGRLRGLRLWPRPRRRLFVGKDCELIEEFFLGLLARGAQFSRLPGLPRAAVDDARAEALPGAQALAADLEALCARAVRDEGQPCGPAVAAACSLTAKRLVLAMTRLRAALPELTAAFERLAAAVGPEAMVVGNYFTGPEERLFGLYCLDRGLAVTSFEHGVTLGLSDWARYPAPFWGMLCAGSGVYHWERSLDDIRPWLDGRRAIMGGVPRVTARVPLRGVQRRLARRWLGIPAQARVVMYVADVERNNAAYGPHTDNDLQYAQVTEAVVDELARREPDAVVLLKLYPTHRYPESHGFEELLARRPQVRVIKDMDFRFIRAAADLIALSSGQSTLGWALGAGCPVWMFEKRACPVRLPGRELDIAVPGVSRVLDVDLPPCGAPRGVTARIMED